MKKKINVLNTIKIIIIVALVCMLTLLFISQKLLKKEEPSENYVSGNQHIYKGQKLDPKWVINITPLLLRANWLNSTQYVDVRIKNNLEQMILDAEKEGMCLVVTSGYRNPDKQRLLYNSAKDKSTVALPYESEHQTGLAVDFAACPMENGIRNDNIERLELKKPFKELPEYCWLVRNAFKYGFEQSFTQYNKDITGYIEEPWHFKYIIQ